jgi:hypothetical protein
MEIGKSKTFFLLENQFFSLPLKTAKMLVQSKLLSDWVEHNFGVVIMDSFIEYQYIIFVTELNFVCDNVDLSSRQI